MKCPQCRSPQKRVIDSRPTQLGTRRRLECLRCQERWTTMEVDEVALEKMKKVSMRAEFMEICQSELNKAYFRMMEQLKKMAVVETALDFDEDGPVPPCEVVSFTDQRFKKAR